MKKRAEFEGLDYKVRKGVNKMAVKRLWEGGFSGRLGVGGPRTAKLPRAPQNGDPALILHIYIYRILKKIQRE